MAGLVEKSICALWRVAVLTVQVGWAPQYTRTKASWTGPELEDVSPATGLSSDWLFDWLRMARYTEYSLTLPAALDGASHDKWAPSAFWFIQTGNKIKFLLLLHLFLSSWERRRKGRSAWILSNHWIAVVSPESWFAWPRSPGNESIRPMTYNTLQHCEHTSRGVTLVTLGFRMWSHCLSMLIPFFQA